MLGELFGGLVDKEKMTRDTIQATLEALTEEYNCSASELWIMIRPMDEKCNFKCYVYKDNKVVREITLKEIIGD